MEPAQNTVNAVTNLLRNVTRLLESDPAFRAAVVDLAHAITQTQETSSRRPEHTADAPVVFEGRSFASPVSEPRNGTASSLNDADASPSPLDASSAKSVPASTIIAVAGSTAAFVSPVAETRAPLPALTLGQRRYSGESLPHANYEADLHPPELNLQLVVERSKLKATASHWAARRWQAISNTGMLPADVLTQLTDLITAAKSLPACYLWMCRSNQPRPELPEHFEILGECFTTLSVACQVADELHKDGELTEQDWTHLLRYLAEAQSAVRVATLPLSSRDDADQMHAFLWLRNMTGERQIYVDRFMKLDDPADPRNTLNLRERLLTLQENVKAERANRRSREKVLNNVRFKLQRIATERTENDPEWPRIIELVDSLVTAGMPASNRDLRLALQQTIDLVPDTDVVPWPRGFQTAMREVDKYIALQTDAPAPDAIPPAELSNEVALVANALAGQTVVLIGGESRIQARRALISALKLNDVVWIATREHESVAPFEAHIARPEVAVVLLAIRWSSHSYGEAKQFCDTHNKPLVRLPGGYNANQIARQIMLQCSDRLGIPHDLVRTSRSAASPVL